VLGTFFSTAVALALLVFFLWWIYYRRTPNGTFQFFLPNNRGAILVSSFSPKKTKFVLFTANNNCTDA
jgi:ribose/xylose/arabinose/galactoside ABC-type transport system permease subunit